MDISSPILSVAGALLYLPRVRPQTAQAKAHSIAGDNLPALTEFLSTGLQAYNVAPYAPPDQPCTCSICLEQILPNSNSISDDNTEDVPQNQNRNAAVKIITCNHIFHQACLSRWLESYRSNRNTCPVCRAQLFSIHDHGQREPNLSTGSGIAIGRHVSMRELRHVRPLLGLVTREIVRLEIMETGTGGEPRGRATTRRNGNHDDASRRRRTRRSGGNSDGNEGRMHVQRRRRDVLARVKRWWREG